MEERYNTSIAQIKSEELSTCARSLYVYSKEDLLTKQKNAEE